MIWLLRIAPLWVVVRVCELLRKRGSESSEAVEEGPSEVDDDSSSSEQDDAWSGLGDGMSSEQEGEVWSEWEDHVPSQSDDGV